VLLEMALVFKPQVEVLLIGPFDQFLYARWASGLALAMTGLGLRRRKPICRNIR
jgi:hypothetical protein